MGLWLGAACKLSYWNDCLDKNANVEPSVKHGIELFVAVPSLLQACPSQRSVAVIPLSMNNPAYLPYRLLIKPESSNSLMKRMSTISLALAFAALGLLATRSCKIN